MRQVLLILLNFSLPFILFALRNWYWRAKNPNKDLPKLNLQHTLRLLAYGCILLFITIICLRLFTPTDQPFHGYDAITRDY